MRHANPREREPTRLSHPERRILLEEIGRLALALGRAQQAAASEAIPAEREGDGSETASPLEQIHRLVPLWPHLQRAFAAISRQPECRLERSAVPVLLDQSRGENAAACALSRSPRAAAAWKRLSAQDAPRICETRPAARSDTAANRWAAAMLRDIIAEAGALASLARYCGADEEACRVQEIAQAGTHLLRSSFLDCLPKTGAGHAASCLMPAGVPYRALFRLHRLLRAPLRFAWEEAALLLPALEDWRLYEIWCFLKTAAAVQAVGWRLQEGDAIALRQDGLRLTLAAGRESRLTFRADPRPASGLPADNARLDLLYQPYFPSANQSPPALDHAGRERPRGFASRSHAMQPDIALRCGGDLLLLDAKFRAYDREAAEAPVPRPAGGKARKFAQDTSLLDDIDKMHAYRDAILRNGRPAVTAAWCLFPGTPGAGEPQIAYPAPTREQPFGTAGVGALRLRPGDSGHRLPELLRAWLSTP